MKDRLAIIDLGSNSVRLVIIEINEDNSFKANNEIRETVRLSEGMGEDNILRPDAIKRTLKALRQIRNLCDANGITRIIAVATAAVRKAGNGSEFVKMVEQDTGIKLKVISGEREAALGYLGVRHTLDICNGYLVDIGGASTEITRFVNKRVVNSISLAFGAVTLTERFLSQNTNTCKQIEELEKYLIKQYRNIEWLKKTQECNTIVGIGGTIRNLGKIDRIKKEYSPNIIHNYSLRQKDVEAIFDDLKLKSLDERMNTPGLAKERADIIVAGICAVYILLQVLNVEKLIISGSGIRDGIFFEYYMQREDKDEITGADSFSIYNPL